MSKSKYLSIASGLAIVSFMACLVVATVNGSEPTKKEQNKTRHIRKLIESLGYNGVRVVNDYPKHDTNPYLVIPRAMDWDSHTKDFHKTIRELIDMGVAAFPELIAHLNDERFCCFVVGEVDSPRRVGSICDRIMECQIDVYPYHIDSKEEGLWSPYPVPGWDHEKEETARLGRLVEGQQKQIHA